MRYTTLAIAITALMLGACSDSEHEVNKSRPISSAPSTPSAVMESMGGKEQGDQAIDSAIEVAKEPMEEVTDTAKEMTDDSMDKAEEMVADSDVMDDAKEMMADTDSADLMDKAKDMAEDSEMMDKAKEMVDSSADSGEMKEATEAPVAMATVSMEDGTALANKSGCFACHAIDRKVLGPAWKDVAAKYADDKAAGRAHLVNKVAKGGKGVWTEVTGGTAMPPYSPRVSDENIETLVDFVLGL